MEIKLAKTAGFCFGVNRAVDMLYKMVEDGEKVCTLGPIIHNPQVIEDLESKGVKVIVVPSKNEKVDLKELMIILGSLKIDSILLEGGGRNDE